MSALGMALAATIGCDNPSPSPQDLAFAEPLVLPGSEDLRVERDSPDVGISVFSYRMHKSMTPDAAVVALRGRVRQTYPCYRDESESRGSLHLRCPDASGGLHATTEIRVIVDGDVRRVFVLMLKSIPADPTVYGEFISTLDQAVQRARAR